MLRRAAFGSPLLPVFALLTLTLAPLLLLGACTDKSKEGNGEARDAAPAPSVPDKVPPAASFNATPVAQFADAGSLDGLPPYEQAKAYEAQGQLWMGRLLLEQKALGADATKDETELLLKICEQQGDDACVEACGKKLGRKIKLDAGVKRDAAAAEPSSSAVTTGREHQEPDTDLAKVRDLVLKGDLDRARKALEPKVLEGKASREEVRLLRSVCLTQKDRMCAALCDAKLK
jgi:hypothetical protein